MRQSQPVLQLEPARRNDVELLASELVTNVVRHAHTDLDLTVCLRCGRVYLMVEDYSDELPHVRSDPGEGGWGLRLVEQLADDWGVDRHPTGKAVWLSVSPPPAGPCDGQGDGTCRRDETSGDEPEPVG